LSSGGILRLQPGVARCRPRSARAAIAGQSLLRLLHRAADVRVREAEWKQGTYDDWAMEAFDIAFTDVYGETPLSKDTL